MKRFLALLTGLLTSGIGAALVVLIYVYSGYSAQSFFIFFIVPIGSILTGILAALGYSFCLKTLNQKALGFDYVIGAVLGLAAGFLIYFGLFMTTYISPEGEIIYSLTSPSDGSFPIANAEFEDGTTLNFPAYMLDDITHRQISFVGRGKPVNIPENATVGWIHFLIEVVGYFVGGLAGMFVFINTKFCDTCKIYFAKGKKEVKIDIENKESLARVEHALQSRTSLQHLLDSLSDSPAPKMLGLSIDHCRQCGDGVLNLSIHEKGSDGQVNKITRHDKAVVLQHFVAKESFNLQEYVENAKKVWSPDTHSIISFRQEGKMLENPHW